MIGSEENPTFITGIRIAESETDVLYDALAGKGRWATQGIRPDNNRGGAGAAAGSVRLELRARLCHELFRRGRLQRETGRRTHGDRRGDGKQDKINKAARERFDKMDVAEQAQRMQAFMMKNPQAAMKMMQAQQAAGTAGQTAIAEVSESSTRLEAELERLQGAFRASSEQARKPVIARQEALIKAKTVLAGETATPASSAAADHAQYVQLIAEENAPYERACAQDFGTNGSFHKWRVDRRRTAPDSA